MWEKQPMSAWTSSCRTANALVRGAAFLKASLEQSRLLRACGRVASLLLSSASNSYALALLRKHLPRLYPERAHKFFDRINAALPPMQVSPVHIFAVAYLLFISLGKMSVLSFSFVVLFLLCFAFAFRSASRINTSVVAFEGASTKLGISVLLISLIAICLDLNRAYDIPLLVPQARLKLSVAYTYVATFLVPAGVLLAAQAGKMHTSRRLSAREARAYTLSIAIAVTFLISLLGYRTQTVVSLLAFTYVMHRYRLIGRAEILAVLGAALLTAAGLGYYRAASLGSHTGLAGVIERRVELTIALYDYAVSSLHKAGAWSLLFGRYGGDIALATFSSFLPFLPGYSLGPRTIVARDFGVTGVSLTSTLLGTVSLDLGLAGVVFFALALGSILGALYALTKYEDSALAAALFGTCYAYLLVGIETGLVDINVFALYSFAAFVALASAGGRG